MSARGLLALALGCVAAGGCGVGDGSGVVGGSLHLSYCIGVTPLDRPCTVPGGPDCYEMGPGFFAGEPIEDVSGGKKQNRLLIRIQPNGARAEVNDALVFDVIDTYEVARCVRGRSNEDGSPDYDTSLCRWITDELGSRPRLKLPSAAARGSLTMFGSCKTRVVGVATASDTAIDDPLAWASWVDLVAFGGAAQSATPAGLRKRVDLDFKVDFGQPLTAKAFQVTLRDDRAIKKGLPPSKDEIWGLLGGSFDFDLLRGRAAQAFP